MSPDDVLFVPCSAVGSVESGGGGWTDSLKEVMLFLKGANAFNDDDDDDDDEAAAATEGLREVSTTEKCRCAASALIRTLNRSVVPPAEEP